MSDSDDDDDYVVFGTPLEPIEEGSVPKKKPLYAEDEIATDKQGRRRFHGAFTGGFSAGFFNSVGTLEGWKPSEFKSSRDNRFKGQQQLPQHFMDDEDEEEFGIAPKEMRLRDEYTGAADNQRKRDYLSKRTHGPIPGEPVLQSILNPPVPSMGIRLLMKMGWKPGDEIGERVKRHSGPRIHNEKQSSAKKVYGCARGPDDSSFDPQTNRPDSDSDSDIEEEVFRELGRAAPSYSLKADRKGLGYIGLDRNALFSSGSSLHSAKGRSDRNPLLLRDQFNNTIRVSGQAFGVGAFEDEDDDIYSTEDRSQYDLSLEPIGGSKVKKSNKNSLPALTSSSDVLPGFVESSFKESLKTYSLPVLPPGFTGEYRAKKSRFSAANPAVETSKQRLDPELRSILIGQARSPVRIKEEVVDASDEVTLTESTGSTPVQLVEPENTLSSDWKPFSADPDKQARYERYLHLVKIGATDLVCTVLLHTMTDIERLAELNEFEGAARLYSGRIVSDRFTRGTSDADGTQSLQPTFEVKKGREECDWAPHSIVCKRFNVKPPHNSTGATLESVASSKKKPRCSVFDFLKAPDSSSLGDLVESNREIHSTQDTLNSTTVKCEILTGSVSNTANPSSTDTNNSTDLTTDDQNTTSLPVEEEVEGLKDITDKMDLFKAIFLDDSDEETAVEAQPPPDSPPRSTGVNLLRNTSPPRGIFANLDLDRLSTQRTANSAVKPEKDDRLQTGSASSKQTPATDIQTNSETEIKTEREEPVDSYGPALPSIPPTQSKTYIGLKLDVRDDNWVERSSGSRERDPKKHHKHKKKKRKNEKKDRKKEKKRKKKKKRHSSSEASETDSDSE